MRAFFLTCAIGALLTPMCPNVANAQTAPGASQPPSVASGDAGTPMSDAWFAKFAPRDGHFINSSGYPCITYLGKTICSVGGGVPSHGKTTTLKKKKHR